MLGIKPQSPLGASFSPKSSNIKQVAFDAGKKALTITFMNGASHVYSGVSEDLYREMSKAESAGKFFAQNIRNNFKSQKLGS